MLKAKGARLLLCHFVVGTARCAVRHRLWRPRRTPQRGVPTNSLLFVFAQFGADVFETRQGLDAPKPVMIRDRLLQIRRHESLYNDGAGSVLLVQDSAIEERPDP